MKNLKKDCQEKCKVLGDVIFAAKDLKLLTELFLLYPMLEGMGQLSKYISYLR